MAIKRIKGKIDTKAIEKNFKKMKKTLPIQLGNQAERHFVSAFGRGGGKTDAGFWPRRKRERKRDIKLSANRPILVLTGNLKKSIQRRFTSFTKTIVSSKNIVYAARHNSGLFKMPKREFIGKSRSLEAKQRRKIKAEMKKLKP